MNESMSAVCWFTPALSIPNDPAWLITTAHWMARMMCDGHDDWRRRDVHVT